MSTQAIPKEHQNVAGPIYDVKNAHLLEQLRGALMSFRKGEYLNADKRRPIVAVVLQKIEELQAKTK